MHSARRVKIATAAILSKLAITFAEAKPFEVTDPEGRPYTANIADADYPKAPASTSAAEKITQTIVDAGFKIGNFTASIPDHKTAMVSCVSEGARVSLYQNSNGAFNKFGTDLVNTLTQLCEESAPSALAYAMLSLCIILLIALVVAVSCKQGWEENAKADEENRSLLEHKA